MITFRVHLSFFYYESINREIKIKPISECQYDERLKTKSEMGDPSKLSVIRKTVGLVRVRSTHELSCEENVE
jgi:hypothetical protein